MASESETPVGQLGAPWVGIRDAYKKGQLTEDTPEIAAIFEQIKHLREAERSLRSLRRTMELDNVPSLDAVSEDEVTDTPAPPQNDLTKLLDSYLALRDEKDALEARFNQMLNVVAELQNKVNAQSKAISELQNK